MFDDYEKLPLCHDIKDSKARTKDVILDDEIKFSSLLLEERIQKGLTKCGFTFLSPIQKNALPLALTGKSIIAHAKSGTGKTLIYLLTALNSFLKSKPKSLFALILAPTREIAKQIYDVCKNISYFIENLKIEFFIGGTPLDIDVIKCKSCHIAIGAPGRIKHLINLGELKVQEVRLLVLDEVDVLLNNKEFAIGEVVAALPSSRQTIVCTATFSDDISILLKPVSTDLKYINMNEKENKKNASLTSNMLIGIKQFILPVYSDSTNMDTIRTRNTLVELLKNFRYDQCFVFVNYISLVKSIYNFLMSNNLSAMWLSSEQNQSTRIATLKKLKMNECKILVTTDLAARGIDVHNVNLVVNLGIPMPPDVYVHRMGRAGRYGSEGSVITIVHDGEDYQMFVEMLRYVITEPVDLHVMPREINVKTLGDELKVLKCDPQSNSAIIREFIAKHTTRIESQSAENKSKKRKRKRKAKDKRLNERVQRQISQTEDDCCLSEEEVSESKPETINVRMLKERFTTYTSTLQSDLDKCASTDVELHSLEPLVMPARPSRPRLSFTNYYEEPKSEKVSSAVVDDVSIDESCLYLAEFSRKTNSYLDSQRIPMSVSKFFALLDRDEKSIINEETTERVRELKKEVLEKLRELLQLPTLLQESVSNITDSVNSSTNDSQEPQPKIQCTGYLETIPSNTPPTGVVDDLRPSFPSSKSTNFFHKEPVRDDFVSSATSTTDEAAQFMSTFIRTPLLINPTSKRLKSVSKAGDKGSPHDDVANVQCPQCQHRFSFHPNSINNDVQSNMLPSLTPYVSNDVAQKIYQSHFNYISNCIQSALPSNPFN